MTGGFEAAADAVTGGLIGRAVESRAGEGHVGGAHDLCLNCGTALIGAHCHACGQSAHVHRTVGAIGHEIAHGVFHFDGKMFRTLPMLAFHPGELTRRYVAGERARFVSPLAIFLFSVFLLFAVVANLPGWHFSDGIFKPGAGSALNSARENLAEERKLTEAKLSERSQKLAKERASQEPDADRIKSLEESIRKSKASLADTAIAEKALSGNVAVDLDSKAGENWFEAKIRHARDNPALLLYKVKMSAYKFSWALIPISLPFIWLLFPFRRSVGFYDHSVFATYSLSFVSLLVIVLALLGAIGVNSEILWTAAVFILPVHMYVQLKGAYRLTRLGALWRTWWMLIFATITTTLFILLLLYLGVAD